LRAQRWCARHRNFLGIVPIIVYQMAKAGSSAVVAGLERARLPAFHVHRMDAGHLRRMREERRALGWSVPPVAPHERLGLRLRRDLLERGGRAVIVTLVRDPIARNVSSYFEHLDFIWQRQNAHESVSMGRLIEGFRTRFPHHEPLTWFDDEMLPVTGIDVFQQTFPESGHLILRNGNEQMELLIMKSESPNAMKAAVLSKVACRRVSLSVANSTSAKSKGPVFQEFLSKLQLAPDYIDEMLESRYARHFYSDSERQAFREKYKTLAKNVVVAK
jgi:hypothetical protein